MGTYNPNNKTGSPLNCKLCDARFHCPEVGQCEVDTVNDQCQEGERRIVFSTLRWESSALLVGILYCVISGKLLLC